MTYDADAARAARREAVADPFVFHFGGQDFTLPTPKEWPISVTATLATGNLVAAMRALLGDSQFAAFEAHQPTLGDVEGIMAAMGKAQGVTLGE